MKDILGKELEIGDIVVEIAPQYSWYVAGKITRFSNKNVFFIYKLNGEGTICEKFVQKAHAAPTP